MPRTRVLLLYGSESGTCKRIARTIEATWAAREDRSFDVALMCDGTSVLKEMSIMEDDANDVYHDFTSLRTKFDAVVVVTSSYGEGDPPENYGPFFVQLVAAAARGEKPLAGMQHAVLGQGSTVYQETFQNVPRLTDRYLGECGSRRFAMRQEVDAAHYIEGDQHVVDRNHFRDTAFAALQSLPAPSTPPVCSWDEARRSHAFPTSKVTIKSAQELSAFSGHSATSGAVNEQAFGMLFWAAVLGVGVAYGYAAKWSSMGP